MPHLITTGEHHNLLHIVTAKAGSGTTHMPHKGDQFLKVTSPPEQITLATLRPEVWRELH